jgi:hypothetical protein
MNNNYFNQQLTFRVWTMDWTKSIVISANIARDKARFLLIAKRELQTDAIQWEISLGANPQYRV